MRILPLDVSNKATLFFLVLISADLGADSGWLFWLLLLLPAHPVVTNIKNVSITIKAIKFFFIVITAFYFIQILVYHIIVLHSRTARN
ncbi:hypothetical protein SDC9_179440 [bioreactor metagenome]|uniref:Uncharacterized protein n=1 Tax=bioreactor metagenome TaxID=1076179 RepID=A0A645GYR7_9ZZZZ